MSSAAYQQNRPDVILIAVTSQTHPEGAFGELAVRGWKEAGLLKASVIKPVLATVEKRLILRRLGRLLEDDRRGLGNLLQAIIGG